MKIPGVNRASITNDFDFALSSRKVSMDRKTTEILQLNIGKLCNLTCSHCHVNAGPNRKEIITRETVDKIINWFAKTEICTLDITGGTPEMIPDFRYLIEKVRSFDRNVKIMDRLNATIINEKGFEWVVDFLAKNKIEIVASMPCYSSENVNAQRGDGVFDSSIKAFQKLNSIGYGQKDDLILNFVYNPLGDALPGDQKELEDDYKREMQKNFGIKFNNLFCITNMPIARFAGFLKNNNKLQDYMSLLKNSFNSSTVENLMCRNTINVSWKGDVYDCDFNQMLRMKSDIKSKKIWDVDIFEFNRSSIRTGEHCFACTAGSGSSCGGALLN